jgi:hypothetical protein
MRHLILGYALIASVGISRAQAVPPFPEPEKVVKDDKQFNAVTLGPGNTFSVSEPPKDMQLEGFDFSADGKLLFMEWGSGRLETRDLESSKRIAQFKPVSGPLFEVESDEAQKQLIVVTEHGLIRFVDPRSGKKLREIVAEKGRFNYDIQKILLAPDGSWLAYVNQDNGKILDLRGDSPRVLADLGDAYDIELSPDRASLWALNRTKIFGLKVSGWEPIATANLLDQVKPESTPMLAILSGQDGPIAFVPSKSGLLRYQLPSLQGTKVTSSPTYWVASDQVRNELFVHAFQSSDIVNPDGALRCHWQIRPSQNYKVSPNGEWIGSRNFGKIELWSTKTLIDSCPAKGGS